MSGNKGWIGVDLDGTLAHYEGWKGVEHIGDPIPEMVKRMREWRAKGQEVRIFTARVWHPDVGTGRATDEEMVRFTEAKVAREAIRQWLIQTFGLEGTDYRITCTKDFGMTELWDDRAVRVVANTGESCCVGVERLMLENASLRRQLQDIREQAALECL